MLGLVSCRLIGVLAWANSGEQCGFLHGSSASLHFVATSVVIDATLGSADTLAFQATPEPRVADNLTLRLDVAGDPLGRERPLFEVAMATGFADQAHFTRVFTGATGIPPGRYRTLRTRQQT